MRRKLTLSVRVNVREACAWLGERRLSLTPKAFAVLCCLIDHAGQLVEKEDLLGAVWAGTVVSDAVLTTCVREIRRRLGERARTPRYIQTVHRRGYRWIAPLAAVAARSRYAEPPADGHPSAIPLVGRAAQLELLRQRFEQARRGQRQLVFVTGEAGIGKTTLVDTWLGDIGTEAAVSARGQCIEHVGAGEAYLPVLDALGRLCRPPRQRQMVGVLRRYAPTWLAQLPWLLRPSARAALQREVGSSTQERMLREMAEALEALTAERPLVLVLEDLHWSDAATLDLLSALARRADPARLLIIGTVRPVEVLVRDHPLHGLTQELELRGHGTVLPLEGLGEADITAYLGGRFPGHTFPPTLAPLLYRRTEGNPLFLVNVVDALIAQGLLVRGAADWALSGDVTAVERELPESLRQMIERHGARLSPEEQRVLEAAAVAGMEFSAAAVAAGLGTAEDGVEARCTALAARQHFLASRGQIEWPDGTITAQYRFLHALYRDAWYARVGEKRRIDLHRAIGLRLEAGQGTQVGAIAAALAVHFEHGRDPSRAVTHLRQAADNAVRRDAYAEGRSLLTRALDLLPHVPDTPARRQHELDLQVRLSSVLMATKGYAAREVETTLTRALSLSDEIGDARDRLRVILALAGFYIFRGDVHLAKECAEQGRALAEAMQRPNAVLWSQYQLGVILLMMGEFAAARAHLEEAAARYGDQARPVVSLRGLDDPGVRSHVDGGLALWCLGYPDQAQRQSRAGVSLAQGLASPLSLASAWHVNGILHQLRGEPAMARQDADTLLELSSARSVAPPRAAGGLMLRGWSMAARGQHEEGLAQIQRGLTLWESTGSRLLRPYALATLADIHLRMGQPDRGLSLVEKALTLIATTGERWYEAELHRLRGELAMAQSAAPDREAEAMATWLKALAIARRQGARSWELRAAVSLARQWRRRDKRQDARALLGPIYRGFAEGHDTADLREARALLTALA